MKIQNLLTAIILGSFFFVTAQAVSFESGIQNGLIKKNAIKTEHFRIEFSDLIEGQIDSDSDGISDTIELIAETAELSWVTFVEDMGYPEPNSDSERKVVIILDDHNNYLFPGALGITSILSNGDPYVAIDPFLSDDLLKVTMAHEFYHVVQFDMGVDFAYYDQGINWAEASAVWSEDLVYDEIDDYLYYLDDYFSYPDYSVFAAYIPTGTLYEYALNIWPHFLSEEYDDAIILDIWEEYQEDDIEHHEQLALYDVISEVIDDWGGSLNEAYAKFALWNLDLDYYDEGGNYPEILILSDLEMEELTLMDETYAPALYGSNYLLFENDDEEDDFYFQIVKPEGVGFAITLVPVDGNDYLGDEAVVTYLDQYEDMDDYVSISGIEDYDSVVAIVSALDADFDIISDPYLIFDEGYLYYYLAQYGDAPEIDTEDVEVENGEEKEGEVSSENEEIRVTDELVLDLLNYDEDSVTLSWNRPDIDIALYDIWYYDSDDYWYVQTIEQGYITSATVQDLVEGETYTFQVYAYDADDYQVGEASNMITVTAEEWLFTDLSFMNPHYDAISSLVEMGIFEGYSDGSFQPTAVINRAELLKILIEGREISIDEDEYKNCFPDVKDDWYAKYVCYAAEQGWVKGYPDKMFKPGNTVNKVEALKMLFNVYEAGLVEGVQVNTLAYPDLDTTAWYAIYVWKASSLGILEETPGEDFNPADGRTRADIGEELYRYLIQI